jgi:hypothetical protein
VGHACFHHRSIEGVVAQVFSEELLSFLE